MRLLLDTHVVIWAASAPNRLPRSLLRAIEKAEARFVSHATAWEIQIKRDKYQARFDFSLPQLEQVIKAFSCTELPIEYQDIRQMDKMRFLHSDPSDRLLMAQAALRPVYLATLDENIINTFESEKTFKIFTDRARVR